MNYREKSEDRVKLKGRGVTFKDGVNPGNGTSSSGGEEMASPPPPSDDPSQGPKKIKIKRKKKVKVKSPKVKEEIREDVPADEEVSPPPAPSGPYPYCPPGILYQVNLPYASKFQIYLFYFVHIRFCFHLNHKFLFNCSVVYAQAVAEKGFDIVFQASSQIPTICDLPCEAVDIPTGQKLDPQPKMDFMSDSSKFEEQASFLRQPSHKLNLTHVNKELSHRNPSLASENTEKPKPVPTVEGCRIPTIVRSTSASAIPPEISYNDFLDHPMSYEMPLNELIDTPTSQNLQPVQMEVHSDNNKIIPVIGHGASPLTSIRHKTKNIHHHHHHHHISVVNKSNIVEVPTVDYIEHSACPPQSDDVKTDGMTVPELL